MTPRTIVLVPALVRTGNAGSPVAEALAVRDGKVLLAGALEQVRRAAGPDSVEERLPGAIIVPGLADAHAHLASLGRALASVRLMKAPSESSCVERAAAAPPTASQGDWLVGWGWDQNLWAAQSFPTRASLDARFPATPVYFTRIDGHAAWVNGEALRRAGITGKTADPPGGRVLRDAQGEPTGVLIDNAMNLVSARLPRATQEQLRYRMKLALERCAAVGLTSIHDAGMDLESFTLLQQWDAVGLLPVRVYAMADGQGSEWSEYLGRGRFEGRHLRLRAVKFLADGALGSRGAMLHTPYSDASQEYGLWLLAPETLQERARAFADAGFQVAVHAIGDKANTVVLDLLEVLEKAHPGSRNRLEHAQVLRQSDVGRIARAGAVASLQPTHATSDMPWAGARLGPEREKLAYAWRSILDTGAHVAFGSDFPIEEPEPLLGLHAARTRQDASGQPEGGWHPEQRVTAEEALAGFTAGAAWAEFAEERRGQLAPGFDADLTALSVDPVASAPRDLLGAKVLMTMVGGADVYRAPELR